MLISILSPAKKFSKKKYNQELAISQPKFLQQTKTLINMMQEYNISELSELFSVSDKIADLNVQRFQNFDLKHDIDNSTPAALAFGGDTFIGLDAHSLSVEQLNYAQKNTFILSGLYGVLQPMDLIHEYRLEMGTKFYNQEFDTLYEFWGNKITDYITNYINENKVTGLVNLSSKEYNSVLDLDYCNDLCPVVDVQFKKMKQGKMVNPGMMVKRYRGMMARYIIENQIKNIADLQQFNYANLQYSKNDSSNNDLLFILKD